MVSTDGSAQSFHAELETRFELSDSQVVFEPEYFSTAEFGNRFWRPKYYSFEIYSTEKLEEKLNYMHLNPVRAGLVEEAVEYRWSSARWYGDRRTVGVPITWVG